MSDKRFCECGHLEHPGRLCSEPVRSSDFRNGPEYCDCGKVQALAARVAQLEAALTEAAKVECQDFFPSGDCTMNPDGDDAQCGTCVARAALIASPSTWLAEHDAQVRREALPSVERMRVLLHPWTCPNPIPAGTLHTPAFSRCHTAAAAILEALNGRN